jgi:hypothetical protein
MPMFLDLHRRVDGATEADIADAHQADRDRQARFDVDFHGYWFAPHSRTLFCLADAAGAEAVRAVHRASHGLVADEVFEVVGSVEPIPRSGHLIG